ncbi:MAG: HEAT repeat domain-containing protein [Eubacterium sp.]|nr:HEAT repeat domain-containing protein [Eubacterium sp.]
MKKRITSWLLVAALSVSAFGLMACGETKNEPTNTGNENKTENTSDATSGSAAETADSTDAIGGVTKEKYATMNEEELIDALIADRTKVTPEEYANLISTFSFVDIEDKEDDPYTMTLGENITSKAIQALDSKAIPQLSEYLDTLLASDSPQVRGYGISLVSSLFGVSDSSLESAKKLMENETDKYVLWCATRALSNEMKKDPDVASFIFRMADNENPKVRVQAALAIGNSWSKGVDGTVDKIIAMMDDEDDSVKKAAIEYSGRLADNAVVKPLEKILKDDAKAAFHASVIKSLVSMWFDYPFHKNTNKKAYKLTMDYLKKKPRSEEQPYWTTVGSFENIAEDKFDDWKKKAKYYSADEVYKVMVDIIKDKKANWLGRAAAIKVIKEHCPKKFKALKSVVNKLKDDKADLLKDSYKTEAEQK